MLKKPESQLRYEKFSNVAKLFRLYFCTPKKKKTVRRRPELTPKFLSNLIPNPARKARPDFATLTYVVFKFMRLSLYVPYFNQEIIQLINYTVGL